MKFELGDLIRIKHGYAFKGEYISTVDNGVVLVTPGNFMIGGGFKEVKCKFFTSNYPDEYILHTNDLIVTMTDLSKDIDTLGYSALIPLSNRVYLHNQRIGLVEIIDDRVNKDYMYWLMRSPAYQKYIAATSSGSTVHHTSPNRIYEYRVDLPDLIIQKQIATILSALDKKISLNIIINENLEQQAQAIFKSWFVDFEPFGGVMPSDWNFKPISELDVLVTDYVANGSFKSLAQNVEYQSKETANVLIRLTDFNNNYSSDMVYIRFGL